jgi:uncharacterized membrane protein
MSDSPQTDKKEVSTNTVMGVLSYIGPLVIVSYLVAKDDPFVKFHIKQGLVLLVIEVATWVVVSFIWFLWFLVPFVNLAMLILAIIGIVNVVQNKEKELPLVGSFAKHFKI